jgi:HD superfamily phosphodiesterase
MLGNDADTLEAAAWLHDIGYAPDLAGTGFHPLDGARYLRDVENADPMLCRLVANHSCAILEAEERGLADVLASEFPAPSPRLNDALAYRDRLSEIAKRYGPDDIVTRFIRKAEPALVSSVARIGQRLFLAQ